MGIAGSIVDQNFFQEYLGMRNESVDETEILRRMEEGIYDHEEYVKAMAWTDRYCKTKEGWDKNRPERQKTREQKDADWEFVVKMTLIVRDLMKGNPRLREMGFKEEEAIGHNAIAAGFSRAASVDGLETKRRFHGSPDVQYVRLERYPQGIRVGY